MTNFKVGDKVRVVKTIYTSVFSGYNVGDVFEVEAVYSESLDTVDGPRLWFGEVEKVTEGDGMVAKFKVGDKVRAIDNFYGVTTVKTSWEGEVSKVHSNGEFDAITTKGGDRDDAANHYEYDELAPHHFELVADKPTKKQRIKALESEVAELKAKVEALEKSQAKPKFVPVTTDNIAVGDKIRVIDAGEIGGGCDLTTGNVYVVTEVNDVGGIYIRDDEDDSLYIAVDELRAIEKVVSE